MRIPLLDAAAKGKQLNWLNSKLWTTDIAARKKEGLVESDE